jgi:RNA polymerase sigma-70 factor (ECF subfamily)
MVFIRLVGVIRNLSKAVRMQLYRLYEENRNDFVRYALSLTHHKEDAEDLVQGVYVKAIMQSDLLETMHPMQIRGWLYQSIKNQFIDQYRRSKRMGDYETAPDASYEANIDDAMITRDLLDKLPENLRAVVALRYIQGYNSVEIGQLLDINPSTVRSRLSHATQLLREILSE